MTTEKDLRIGNCIMGASRGLPVMVTGRMIAQLEDGIMGVQPIELTSEILEKCGFKNLSRSNIYVKVMHSIGSNKLKSLAVYLDDENYTIAIVDYYTGEEKTDLLHKDYKYLHELQNLYFALMGEELIFSSPI